MLANLLNTLPSFLTYMLAAVGLALIFIWSYVNITPHREFELIKQGNTAAAIQLVLTFIGWAIPMAVVTSHSIGILDMIVWGVVSLLTQIILFFVVSKIFKGISDRLAENCMSSGVFIGGFALALGILQAGCMVP